MSFAYPSQQAIALRDPFFLLAGNHLYSCSAIGSIKGFRLALLAIDARCYTVKEGDSVAGHIVIAIEESYLVVRDEKGHELRILAKKDPST
jgi:hypothetical protein